MSVFMIKLTFLYSALSKGGTGNSSSLGTLRASAITSGFTTISPGDTNRVPNSQGEKWQEKCLMCLNSIIL